MYFYFFYKAFLFCFVLDSKAESDFRKPREKEISNIYQVDFGGVTASDRREMQTSSENGISPLPSLPNEGGGGTLLQVTIGKGVSLFFNTFPPHYHFLFKSQHLIFSNFLL